MGGARGPVAWSREVIDRQVKHLARLIDDLLDVSRITRGKIRLRTSRSTWPGPSSAMPSRPSGPLIERARHDCRCVGPRRLGEADPIRLEQIVVKPADQRRQVHRAGGRIAVARGEGGEVVVRVRDTGIGIPPEMLPRIFDLFAQGDRSLDRSRGGWASA